MKFMKTKLLAFALFASTSLSAIASPAVMLPAGPLFLKFTGVEQIAINGATTAFDAASAGEINWGVFTISTMNQGLVSTPHEEIQSTGFPFFTNSPSAQITGMFYGAKQGVTANTEDKFPATGGFLDLYWRDLSSMSATDVGVTTLAGPTGIRTATNKATGYTEGTFLAHIAFTIGIDPGGPNVTISGTTVPQAGGFAGHADSFGSVDFSQMGLWSTQLASQYFTTAFGTADMRFKSSYNNQSTWNDANNANILGAKVDDPAQAFALPEPGALSLMGLALVGMGAIRRRKQK